ncbi:MAG: type VI secretion system protein TssA [Desulfovibrionaceae bacterium]|nr:type VI secretion system protein TssA [Desulfovibrionaceae bacterium]
MAEISFETLGSCPVPGETQAGGDARYEPEYAAVLEEIEKLSFSGQGAAISWPAIEKNAVIILSEKSKDLQIAAYLGVALWQNRGLAGMLDGLHVLAGFLETFWETGWPALKRLRGRINAIDWWHERTYGFLQDAAGQSSPIPTERQKELLDGLAKLDELVSSLMPDASPLRDLTAAVQRLPLIQDERPTDKPPSAEPPAPEPPAAEPPAPQVAVAQEAPKENPPLSSGQAKAAQVAPALPETDDPLVLRRHFVASGLAYLASARRAEPGNASLWQLSRLIIWGGIAALPASEDGQTLLPVPDMDVLARARRKLEAGQALEAAFEAEDFFTAAPFCLDAQETVHKALFALGPQFADAAGRVLDESARFFSRLPGLEKLSFTDGTPLASPGTIIWLREAASGASRESGPRTSSDAPCETALASARELMAQNKLAEALAALEAAKTASPALTLRLRVHQLRLLRGSGQTEAAQALAEVLLEEITTRDLDNWDHHLTLETLMAARDAFTLSEARYERELRDVRRRIVRLSPAAALG